MISWLLTVIDVSESQKNIGESAHFRHFFCQVNHVEQHVRQSNLRMDHDDQSQQKQWKKLYINRSIYIKSLDKNKLHHIKNSSFDAKKQLL